VELLKSHSCLTPEERLQKEAEDEAEAERVSLNTQLESLLQEHGGAEDRNNTNGSSGIMGEIIIYVTQEGQDEPTQVRLRRRKEVIYPSFIKKYFSGNEVKEFIVCFLHVLFYLCRYYAAIVGSFSSIWRNTYFANVFFVTVSLFDLENYLMQIQLFC
jgi:hypothetical protein